MSTLPGVNSQLVTSMLVYHGQITHGLLQVLICYSHRIVHTTVLRTTRSWRTFNFDAFIRDLRESSLLCQPPTDVDQLFDCYHQTLQTLVDVHAPLKTVLVRANRTARWYDAECRCTKRDSENGEDWFRSYLSGRTQTFIVGAAESHTVSMDCSVPVREWMLQHA